MNDSTATCTCPAITADDVLDAVDALNAGTEHAIYFAVAPGDPGRWLVR